MRVWRYFLAGFQTLVALFFLCVAAIGVIQVVEVCGKGTPVERTKRAVVVEEMGRGTVAALLGGLFAYGMGRWAVRNFRGARVKTSPVQAVKQRT